MTVESAASKERLQQALEGKAATSYYLPFAWRNCVMCDRETSCSNLRPIRVSGKLRLSLDVCVFDSGFWWLFSCILMLTQSFLTQTSLISTFASWLQPKNIYLHRQNILICQLRNEITTWWHRRRWKFLPSVWEKWEYALCMRSVGLVLLCLFNPTEIVSWILEGLPNH